MGRKFQRLAAGGCAVLGSIVLMAGPAAAHECTNASKDAHNAAAGAQIIINGVTGEPEYIKPGLLVRIDHGTVNFDTGAGFHGLIGIDVDGDGTVDFTTYIVGPNGELPLNAQFNGSPDHGIVNLCGTGCPDE